MLIQSEREYFDVALFSLYKFNEIFKIISSSIHMILLSCLRRTPIGVIIFSNFWLIIVTYWYFKFKSKKSYVPKYINSSSDFFENFDPEKESEHDIFSPAKISLVILFFLSNTFFPSEGKRYFLSFLSHLFYYARKKKMKIITLSTTLKADFKQRHKPHAYYAVYYRKVP
jgi:hypothetical protein